MKYLQSIIPILVMVGVALMPQLQAVISAHPTVAAIVAAVLAVANHLTTSPVAPVKL
jgi:hypothetical protein